MFATWTALTIFEIFAISNLFGAHYYVCYYWDNHIILTEALLAENVCACELYSNDGKEPRHREIYCSFLVSQFVSWKMSLIGESFFTERKRYPSCYPAHHLFFFWMLFICCLLFLSAYCFCWNSVCYSIQHKHWPNFRSMVDKRICNHCCLYERLGIIRWSESRHPGKRNKKKNLNSNEHAFGWVAAGMAASEQYLA